MPTLRATSPTPEFDVEITVDLGIVVVVVRGEADVATATRFAAAVEQHPDAPIVVDLCACDFMDSAALAVVIRRYLRKPDLTRVACVVGSPPARLFALAVQTMIPLDGSRDEAVAALRQSPESRRSA